MISYWVNQAGAFGMEQWLLHRAPELAGRIRIRTYESLTPTLEVQSGAHVFSALDQLGPHGLATVAGLWDHLADRGPGIRLLNDPRKAACRLELLNRLFAAGINRHRAHAADAWEWAGELGFPVFVREESGHAGPLTGLLQTPRELARALRALRVRGYRRDELLVLEFCDVAGPDGVYHAGAVCRVGDRIAAAQLLRGRRWVLKWDEGDHDEAAMRAFRDYVDANPHAEWVRRVFEVAAVDFGRLDYGIRGTTLVAWEINLNPTLGPTPGATHAPLAEPAESLMWEARRNFVGRMREAFQQLDPDADDRPVALQLDSALVSGMHDELAEVQRRRARVTRLRSFYGQPLMGWPFRRAMEWLYPYSSER